MSAKTAASTAAPILQKVGENLNWQKERCKEVVAVTTLYEMVLHKSELGYLSWMLFFHKYIFNLMTHHDQRKSKYKINSTFPPPQKSDICWTFFNLKLRTTLFLNGGTTVNRKE